MPRTFDPAQALANVGDLVFARVTRVVRPDDAGDYYYGFAQDGDRPIWFQQTSRRPEIYVGPATMRAGSDAPPRRRTVVAGHVRDVPGRGAMFDWWFADAGPLLELRNRLRHTVGGKRGRGRRLRELLGSDDLYVLARVLVYGDVHVLADQLVRPPEDREVHPLRTKDGHVLRRGYDLERHPLEFAAILAHFAGCADLLATFNNLIRGRHEVDEETARVYSETALARKLRASAAPPTTKK